MAKPKVFATHRLFEPARKILQEHCEVEYWEKPERPPREEVLRRVKDKEALVCLLTEKVNDELLQAAPKLKIAANVAVGFDNIDVAACTRRGVVATNTPGVLDETTADFAWTLLMAVARRLLEGDALARSGNWKGWDLDQLVGTDVWGKTLGIVGFGRIGKAMARRASGFQMKVIYKDAVRAPEELGAAAMAVAGALLTKSFSSLLGLKNGIFLAGTSTLSPVLGLRPMRGLRWRVRKLPNPRISILSPVCSERTMLPKMVSTITSLSLRVSSTMRETSSIRSAFVMILASAV